MADMNAPTLSGQVAVVTGGNGGLGRVIVARLVREGARVAILDSAQTDGAASDFILPLRCDVTEPDDVSRAVESIHDAFGPVRILVNNAGLLGPVAAVLDLAVETWRRVIDVNLTGTFVCCNL